MVSQEAKKTIVIFASVIVVVVAIVIVLLIVLKKPSSSCPLLEPPSVQATGSEDIPFKAIVVWDVVPGATTYAVYRKSSPNITSSSYDEKVFTTSNSVTFDGLMTPLQYFRVSVFNACGEGKLSDEEIANVYCRPQHPNGLYAESTTPTEAMAYWDPVVGVAGYHLYVNGNEVWSGSSTNAVFATPTSGTYEIQVSSQNACGEGFKSPQYDLFVPVVFI